MKPFASTLDSTLESVDAGEESVRRFAAQAGFDESARYFVGLAVREILVNAVRHGNRFDPGKKVEFRLSADDTKLIVEVPDQGGGSTSKACPTRDWRKTSRVHPAAGS